MTEVWRQTHLHPLYEVSDAGNVRRRMVYTNYCTLRPLKPYPGRKGYLKVQLGFQGPRIYVHKLVCIAFHGPKPSPSMTVDHRNFVHTDNRATNLRWLPGVDNRPRFKRRDPLTGRIEWIIPNVDDWEPPEDHVPMTEQETRDYDPTANGW